MIWQIIVSAPTQSSNVWLDWIGLFKMKMKALCSFEMSATIYPKAWYNIPEDLNLYVLWHFQLLFQISLKKNQPSCPPTASVMYRCSCTLSLFVRLHTIWCLCLQPAVIFMFVTDASLCAQWKLERNVYKVCILCSGSSGMLIVITMLSTRMKTHKYMQWHVYLEFTMNKTSLILEIRWIIVDY